jgi:glycine/serine hydroxymethyltransferase
MKEAEMEKIGQWIARVIDIVKDDTLPPERSERSPFVRAFKQKALENADLLAIRDEVKAAAGQFPLFTW